MRAWVAVLLLCSGCAYNTTGRSAANVGNIYIPFFADETSGERAPDLGTRATQLLVLEFQRDKEIHVYQGDRERDLADKELLGTVKRLSEAVLTRSAEETQEEYRVVLTCAIQYTDIASGAILWQDGALSGDGNYRIDEGEPGFQRALDEALGEVIDKILDKTVRAW